MAKTLKLKRFTLFVLVFMLAPFKLALAEDYSALNDFIGQWQANGKAFGQPAFVLMEWAPTLNDKFVRLDYSISSADKNSETGERTLYFQGVAYYKQLNDNTLKAFWADNTGDFHPIQASRDGNTLIVLWGVEGEKQGKTKYALTDSDSIQVTDWILKDDVWTEFSDNLLFKVEVE